MSRRLENARTCMADVVREHSWLDPEDRDRRYARWRETASGIQLRCIDVGEREAYNGAAVDLPDGRKLVFYRGGGRWPGGRLRYVILPAGDDAFVSGHVPLARDAGLAGNDEDPRILVYAGRLLVTTAKFENDIVRMELWHAAWPDGSGRVTFEQIARFDTIHNWPGYVPQRFEKNWSPFEHDGRLYYVYSARPHRVLEVELSAGRVRLAYETDGRAVACHGLADPEFDIRLNTPPVRLSDGRFLSTYHVGRHVGRQFDYYTGFYTFTGRPPFEPLASTGPFLLPEDAEGFIPHDNRPTRCVFITGMSVNEAADEITLWGGDTDKRVITGRVSLRRVLAALQ